MTTKDKLTQLNALRVANGMKPLKTWKESTAKLDAVIAKLQSTSTTKQQLEASVKTTKGDAVSITTIAKELGINDKVARAKLRRCDNVPAIDGVRWMFAPKDVETIKAILKGDRRKG